VTIRDSIASLKIGTLLVMEHRHQADYAMALAKQTGHKLDRQKEDGVFVLECVAVTCGSALAWLNRIRVKKRATNKWRNNHPERYHCQEHVRKLIKAKLLVRLPCEVCGNTKSQAHHPDYTKPDKVVWLCQKHHTAEHQKVQMCGENT
jgi:hypothetical protein